MPPTAQRTCLLRWTDLGSFFDFMWAGTAPGHNRSPWPSLREESWRTTGVRMYDRQAPFKQERFRSPK